MRDNFLKHTLDIIAKRVGIRCSNPGCRKSTTGPRSESNQIINIGVGAQNSILFVVRGMILAHTFPVALTQNEVTINQDMKGITPIKQTNLEYLFFVLKNMQNKVLSYIKEATHGTLRLEMSLMQTLAVPLPPLEEQKEIVRQVDKLSQSVLAKAFRGELTPQDPNDEPAEKLLERIMAEKAKMEEALKEGKKKGAGQKAKAGSRK